MFLQPRRRPSVATPLLVRKNTDHHRTILGPSSDHHRTESLVFSMFVRRVMLGYVWMVLIVSFVWFLPVLRCPVAGAVATGMG